VRGDRRSESRSILVRNPGNCGEFVFPLRFVYSLDLSGFRRAKFGTCFTLTPRRASVYPAHARE